MSLQNRFMRPNFNFKGSNRQLPSRVKIAESALILSDECKIYETRCTQWVVDSPSPWTQAARSTMDLGCLHVSLKFWINRARN